MKNIVLTLDYELFFGKKAGNIDNCMINPMDLLIDLMAGHNCKMTIFWDVLHYMRAIELNKKYEVEKLKDSIERLVKAGHDIQLHIHSHWLDAQIENNEWIFPTYEHYKLQSFSKNKILEIVTNAKKTIEDITKEKVTSFRAGGWQIEPFDMIKEALEVNSIFIDSSIAYDTVIKSKIINVDFRNYPTKNIYKFSVSPKIEDANGKFTEIQISRIKIPNYIMFVSYLKRYINKNIYKQLGDGTGAEEVGKTKWQQRKVVLKRLCFGTIDMLSLEFRSEILFNYLLKKSINNAVMIGHPKSVGYEHIKYLDKLLSKKEFKFISLKDITV